MEIMDPFTHELLARPPPPGFDPFSYSGAMAAEFTTEQLDEYLRAIGVFPPLPPADVVPPTSPGSTTPAATLWGAMELPTTCELYTAALYAHVHPGPAVPLPAPAAPSSHAAAAPKNSVTTYDADIDASLRAMEEDPRERPSPDYLDTMQAGRMDPVARATLAMWMCDFSGHFGLGAATLHRAVSYAVRFLSAAAATSAGSTCTAPRRRGQVRGPAHEAEAERQGHRLGLRVRVEPGGAGHGARPGRVARVPARRPHGAHVRGPLHASQPRRRRPGGPAHGASYRGHVAVRPHCFLKLLPSAVAAAAILLAMLALKPLKDHKQVQGLSRELEEMTGYKPMDVHDAVDCMYQLIPDPGFDISPLFLADSSK